MTRFERGIRSMTRAPAVRNSTTVASLTAAGALAVGDTSISGAMKLSTVNRCIEVLSDSIAKMPIYVMDRETRDRVDHPINDLLMFRPNSVQTPTVMKKMVEANRNSGGNGYIMIIRHPVTMRPQQLIPVPDELCRPFLDTNGLIWYHVTHPFTGKSMLVEGNDMVHVRAYSRNGWDGISVLQRASEVLAGGRAAQQYNANYYQNGGHPSGVLSTDADLSRKKTDLKDAKGNPISYYDAIRSEWEKHYNGPANSGRTAVLDNGLKYEPISISNRDAQFVEQSELSVQDIARFFGVPLYKLQAGKQSYNSNEQNAIEYIVATLHPIVSQYEEELTYKLLSPSEAKRYKIRMNMMAELRGDFTSRAAWYKAMREIGVYSVNDILALEDLPDVEGGDERYASLNFVPLSLWREATIKKLTEGGTNNANAT